MEDYKKEYEEALGRARTFNQRWQSIEATDSELALQELKEIFPELKESEDLKIKRDIQYAVRRAYGDNSNNTKSIFAWLEKQTIDISSFPEEQRKYMEKYVNLDKTTLVKLLAERDENIDESLKASTCDECDHPTLNCGNFPCDKVTKPKFKVGDWITRNDDSPVNKDYNTIKVLKAENGNYTIESIHGYRGYNTFDTYEKDYHQWTIQDAKDGDVLAASDGSIFIFKEIVDCGCKHYIALEKDNETINVNNNLKHFWEAASGVKPATKEQREIFFQKIVEVGYIWDPEKKMLTKIEDNPVPIVDDWVEDYWKHHKVNNPDSYDSGEEIQFDHDGFVRFCQTRCQKSAWSEEDEIYLQDVVEWVTNFIDDEDCGDMTYDEHKAFYMTRINWLKSLKERMKGE